MTATTDTWEQLPADLPAWSEPNWPGARRRLVWVELNLDARLHYALGLLVLTDQRLDRRGPGGVGGDCPAGAHRPLCRSTIGRWQ